MEKNLNERLLESEPAVIRRTILELRAVDDAYAELRYLQVTPRHDTWKNHCAILNYKLADAIERAEFWAAHPDHKLG